MIPLVLLLVLQVAICSAQITNLHVKRVTDVASSIAISRTDVTMRNDESKPLSFFYVALTEKDALGLGDFWITSTDSPKNALHMQPAHDLPGLDDSAVAYKVFFSSKLMPEAEVAVQIRMDTSGTLRPVPEIIEAYQSQYMKYSGNAYFYTPYVTKSMESTFILGSAVVTSNDGIPDPFEITGKRLNLGPHKDVEPFSRAPFSIRFKNDRAHLVAKSMIKQFYVSHWGTVATKEEYIIRNAAAAHQGEWSRVDHNRFSSKYATAAGDVWANLPSHATHVNYKDLVGNITSSRLRKPSKGKLPIQLTFRFPLMGGWRDHFWITYDTLLSKYGISKGSEHILTLPLFPTVNLDLLCEQLEVRVLLPEGAHNIVLKAHPSITFNTERTRERTTLTLFGRPVLTLRKKAIRSQSKHAPYITIKYRYNTMLIWITPIFIAGVILCFFTSCILCVRYGLNNVEHERPTKDLKTKTS